MNNSRKSKQSKSKKNAFERKRREPARPSTCLSEYVDVDCIDHTYQDAMKMEGVVVVRHCRVKPNLGIVFATDIIITPVSARNMTHNVQRTTLLLLYKA